MKKRLLLSLLLILSLVTLTGCDLLKNKDNTTKTTTKAQEKGNIKVGDYYVSLTEQSTFDDATFKFPKNTIVSSVGSYTILYYMKTGTDKELFRIGINKFLGSITQVMGENFIRQGVKSFNGLTWEVYSDTAGNITYAHYHKDYSYVFGFISQEDMSEFQEEFIKNVTFKN